MKSKKDHCNFDDTLREKFSSFEKMPNADMYDHISQELKDQTFDKMVYSKIKDFSTTPDKQVWNKVKTELPLNLQLKRALQVLSKVAAVSVLCIFTFYFWQEYNTVNSLSAIVEESPSVTVPIEVNSTDNDFVFTIEEQPTIKKTDIKTEKKGIVKKEQKKSAADFLSFILEEEEEGIVSKIDLNTIREALVPIEKLSSKYLSAKALQPLPKTKSQYNASNTFVLDVTIPMQIAEPDEIESLIELYDNRAFE